MTPARTALPAPAEQAAPGIAATLGSEWVKLWALPENRVIAALAVGLSVGVTVLMSVFGDTAALAREQAAGEYSVAFFGATFGVWTFSALAANVVAAEYRTGAIAWTLTATPRRWRPLAAKLLVLGAAAVLSGLVISLLNFWVTQTALASAGEDTISLADPGMLRAALVFIPLSMTVQALMTASAAVVLRSAPGAFVFVVLFGLLPITISPFLGAWWGETVPRHMAGAATESVAGMAGADTPAYLPALPATVVIAVWLTLFVAVAMTVFTRRDA